MKKIPLPFPLSLSSSSLLPNGAESLLSRRLLQGSDYFAKKNVGHFTPLQFIQCFEPFIDLFQKIIPYVGQLSCRPIKISDGLPKPTTTEMHNFHILTFQFQKIIFYVNIGDIIQDYFRIDMSFSTNSSYCILINLSFGLRRQYCNLGLKQNIVQQQLTTTSFKMLYLLYLHAVTDHKHIE